MQTSSKVNGITVTVSEVPENLIVQIEHRHLLENCFRNIIITHDGSNAFIGPACYWELNVANRTSDEPLSVETVSETPCLLLAASERLRSVAILETDVEDEGYGVWAFFGYSNADGEILALAHNLRPMGLA